MTKGWFPAIEEAVYRCKAAIFSWVFEEIGGSGTGYLFNVTKRVLLAVLTCVLAFGGSIVGTVIGAMEGQTTETGFFRGAGVGALAGAVTAVQLSESMVNGESLPKVALFLSLLNGKGFVEWVIPAVLKAYQWQISTIETSYGEISDIYDISGARVLSQASIRNLPVCRFHHCDSARSNDVASCTICLQDFQEEDCVRKLPLCSHLFHLGCIDAWLIRQGTCPICRAEVCKDATMLESQ